MKKSNGKKPQAYSMNINKIQTDLLEEIVNYANINFFAIDENGNYILKNKSLEKIVGETGKADTVNEKAWQNCQKVMNNRERIIIEEEHKEKWYLSVKIPMIEENAIKGVMGLSLDITEKKQAEIAKDEFLKSINHDIRTPFFGLYSLLKTLLKKKKQTRRKKPC